MLRPLTTNLLLGSDETEVTQAVPMGKHTGFNISVTLHSALSSGVDLRVYMQGSNDLDHWESFGGYTQFTTAPDNDQFPVSYPVPLSAAFVRALYVNGSIPVMFSADINLVEL